MISGVVMVIPIKSGIAFLICLQILLLNQTLYYVQSINVVENLYPFKIGGISRKMIGRLLYLNVIVVTEYTSS